VGAGLNDLSAISELGKWRQENQELKKEEEEKKKERRDMRKRKQLKNQVRKKIHKVRSEKRK
jgi:hypothetical protein